MVVGKNLKHTEITECVLNMILTHDVVTSGTSITYASTIFLVSLNCVLPLSLLETGSILALRYSLLLICSSQHCLTLSVCLLAVIWTVSLLKNCQGNFISNLSFLYFSKQSWAVFSSPDLSLFISALWKTC